jgi:hypothetical protein
VHFDFPLRNKDMACIKHSLSVAKYIFRGGLNPGRVCQAGGWEKELSISFLGKYIVI